MNPPGTWWTRHRGAALFALTTLLLRLSWTRRMVLDGLPYFADADCYTRMFRVRQLLENGAWFQPFHAWENYPEGIVPHTTAPLDWIIALLALPLRLLSPHGLDWAGWITPPLLAALGAAALWHLAARLHLGWTRWPILLTYSLHPFLAWGNAAGRPDHQTLLIPLLSILLLFECLRLQENRFHLACGLGWGLALWTSLYEPAILLAALLFGHALAARAPQSTRPPLRWRPWALGLITVFTITWFLEGARLPHPPWPASPEMRHWLSQIGEMRPPHFIYILQLGLAWPITLFFLTRLWRQARPRLLLLLPALLTVTSLAFLQQRWFYFLPLLLSLTLLPALITLPSPAWRTFCATLHLLPMAAWLAAETSQLRPPHDLADLRRLAGSIRSPGAILAPWWQSPALLYYSGQPIVASSSHQSLPGIIDWARFTTSSDFVAADALLQHRRVTWVVIEQPIRAYPHALALLHGPNANPTVEARDFSRLIHLRLWEFKSPPTRYRLVYASPERKLYLFSPPPTP